MQFDKTLERDIRRSFNTIRDMRRDVTAMYGERCADFEKLCVCCKAWKAYDAYCDIMEDMFLWKDSGGNIYFEGDRYFYHHKIKSHEIQKYLNAKSKRFTK